MIDEDLGTEQQEAASSSSFTAGCGSLNGRLLALAGPMGAGKTSLATELSEMLHWPVVSIRDFIAKVAMAKGNQPTRSMIQAVGMDLVDKDAPSFAALFLEDCGWSPGSAVIIDSIRQPVVYYALADLVAPSALHLVFLQAPFEVRTGRVYARERMTSKELREFDGHPVEVEVSNLRPIANLILDGLDETHDLAMRVLDWLQDFSANRKLYT